MTARFPGPLSAPVCVCAHTHARALGVKKWLRISVVRISCHLPDTAIPVEEPALRLGKTTLPTIPFLMGSMLRFVSKKNLRDFRGRRETAAILFGGLWASDEVTLLDIVEFQIFLWSPIL